MGKKCGIGSFVNKVNSGAEAAQTAREQAGIATAKAAEAVAKAAEAQSSAATATQSAAEVSANTNAAQIARWSAEADKKTADSYATQPQGEHVIRYTSNGDGTFTLTVTDDYSALHYKMETEARIASVAMVTFGFLSYGFRDGSVAGVPVKEAGSNKYIQFVHADSSVARIPIYA